ncbi:hypothetical protein K402DRAFT_424812 [Aulographum hederae CBS 113979]|uniref:Autophagy-related protein 13 n=1 Tax=Aulographum hederae CBS 113979 TaxID=1176131 RepID=A0A6G1GMA9_9PEZI|nr:hypothetical protein K402DRAFT_424812 [Aulographum hederae CBS 113979]
MDPRKYQRSRDYKYRDQPSTDPTPRAHTPEGLRADMAEAMSEGENEQMQTSEQILEQRLKDEEAEAYRLNNFIRNWFGKAALIIVSSRLSFPPWLRDGEIKINKWFGLLMPDVKELSQAVFDWRSLDLLESHPDTLYVEIYLDWEKELRRGQTLVLLDSRGYRTDVSKQLAAPAQGNRRQSAGVVLERWAISLGPPHTASRRETLASAYKKGIVQFRTLHHILHTLPTWKYWKSHVRNPSNVLTLKPRYRIVESDDKSLRLPLSDEPGPVTGVFEFESSPSPGGSLNIQVEYRHNCDFRVDENESLFSSELGRGQGGGSESDDEGISPYGPVKIDYRTTHDRRGTDSSRHVPGSLPTAHRNRGAYADPGQAYGSMGTFHQVGPATGSSPMSALRAARDGGGSSSSESPPQKIPPNHRTATGSKSSLRSESNPVQEPQPNFARRTSVSFQPFKAGSLASSPLMNPPVVPPSPGTSLGRGNKLPSYTSQPRNNRNSLTTLPQTALRTPNLPNETAIASSASSSPKPAPIHRYSSSFSNRKPRTSNASAGGSKTEDDNNSSGRGSVSSSAQRGSGNMNEGGSSGSMQNNDDDFLKAYLLQLDSAKSLKSFDQPTEASRDATMKKTTAALSKYRGMKESNNALSDSISGSLLLHRSSSSSSRQISSVPPMVGGASFSTSSSPGKPISPHTPHTPAIPSRLSANSIIDYSAETHRSRSRTARNPSRHSRDEDTSRRDSSSTATATREGTTGTATGTTAIDIPTSPRLWGGSFARRSSSVAQQHRATATALAADDADPYGLRAAHSLPAADDGRQDLSLSELLHLDLANDAADADADAEEAEETSRSQDRDEDEERSRDSPRSAMERPTSRAFGETRGGLGRGGVARGGGRRRDREDYLDDDLLLFTMDDSRRR